MKKLGALKITASIILVSTAVFCVFRRMPECFASDKPAALAVAAFVLFRLWFNQRESSRAFNSLLDLYDVLDGVSLSDEQSAELYKIMTDIAQRFADRLPVISMADVYDKLINLIIEINDQTINEFIKNDKFFGKMVETED